MKKCQKILLLITLCYISYFFSLVLFNITSFNKYVAFYISYVFLILPLLIYFLIIKRVIENEKKEVIKSSLKIQKLIELNNQYKFKKILKKNRNISEREYSRKSLDRVTSSSIIKYHIENNIDSIRTDIENYIYNINLFEIYKKNVNMISNIESENNSNFSIDKFKKIENKIYNSLIINKDDFLINLDLEVYYRSNGGKVYDCKRGKFTINHLISFYREWKNGKKFEETKRQERKIMNDSIRYNVLKRDNYKCQICGVTAKEGAKLHVDHIIPVSKGGKTVMSNLQTLCDRCNLGKGNKVDEISKMSTVCPKCGGNLIQRNGKYGKFIGCCNYPKCNYREKCVY